MSEVLDTIMDDKFYRLDCIRLAGDWLCRSLLVFVLARKYGVEEF